MLIFPGGCRSSFPNEKRKKYSDENLAKKRYSCSTFMLYLGVDREYNHLMHNNVSWLRIIGKIFWRLNLTESSPVTPLFIFRMLLLLIPKWLLRDTMLSMFWSR